MHVEHAVGVRSSTPTCCGLQRPGSTDCPEPARPRDCGTGRVPTRYGGRRQPDPAPCAGSELVRPVASLRTPATSRPVSSPHAGPGDGRGGRAEPQGRRRRAGHGPGPHGHGHALAEPGEEPQAAPAVLGGGELARVVLHGGDALAQAQPPLQAEVAMHLDALESTDVAGGEAAKHAPGPPPAVPPRGAAPRGHAQGLVLVLIAELRPGEAVARAVDAAGLEGG
mmetsp:Transcript_7719/g.26273  ORF Transcript_7719/g.26273 Transcript_7719/m.26273 type:complete len:224 (-) Transcript_7719:509-1180(-)